MKARCKFNVVGVTDFGNDMREVRLAAVCDSSVPENQAFTKYTPSGTATITITNPAVFVPGRAVYLDITAVES